jgi:hypothetical protein
VLIAWEWLLAAAERLAKRPALILGDLNAGSTQAKRGAVSIFEES